MRHIKKLWGNMLARRTLSTVLCLTLAVTSGGVCIASTNNLVQETRAAGGQEAQPEGEAETAGVQKTREAAVPETSEMEGEALENDIGGEIEAEEEDKRCIHEFTAAWVGYECKLTDFVDGYEPGDEVRISASFNKPVTSQFGLYIDGAWNSFRGEGRKRNITLVPDSDYLNIQISDLKGQPSVNLTEVTAEIVRKGEADTGNYLHKFTGLWQGFETKFSDFNPDYEPGDEIRVTVNYSKYVSSQLGMNIGGEWSTLAGEGKELVKEMTPDNDYLNIQITDMWANYKVGIISVSVDILKKGPGAPAYGGGGRLAATRYTEPGDYVLFSGDANEKYETNDGWLLDCADTDWITLKYSCVEGHENWGIMGWGATVDGQWVDGPGYSADSSDSTKEVTQTFSVKYLRRMMKITPQSNVSYLNLGSYSDGRIEELTLHVGSEIPREKSLFKDGAPNQAWVCTDIERILDAPDDKYLCVQYRCAVSDFNGWTILNWGASVNGEWRNGKSYKASYKEATREKIISMRMDAFRNMLHLSWEAKVDSIQLAAYNDAQILDIWISDDKVEDPGEEKKEKEVREASYHSSNSNAYGQIMGKDGEKYDQNISLENWEWKDLKGARQIIGGLKENVHLILEFEAEDGDEPTLQFSMADGKQQGVKPTYVLGNKALFSFKDIQDALPDYMIPQEISNLQVSAGEGKMTVKTVRVIQEEVDFEQEPIGVLTESWSGFGTQISKWHSDYEPGKDTVKVTVTFDKPAPGSIAFNMGGVWNNGGSVNSATITRTAKPDDDYLGIQLGEMPKGKSHVLITDIKVEIVGKINFDEHVKVEGKRSVGMLASTKKEAATAVLEDEEIKKGMKVVFDISSSSLSSKEQADVKGLFGSQAGKIGIAKVVDINVYKEKEGKRTKVTQTNDPVSFKVSVPDELQNKGYDFAVVEDHAGEKIYLEKLDGNPATVTFASSKFSKFAVVYGEAGAFDGLSGAVAVFRQEWNGWETPFSRFKGDFEAGRPTTVTLTFDREVKPNIVYYSPWTRVESDAARKTFQTTIVPTEDRLEIALSSLNGNSMAKLMSVKVEQEKEVKPEAVHTFKKNASGQYDSFDFKLSDYGTYVVGDTVKVTIKMSSESGFNGAVGTNENGSWKDKSYATRDDNYVEEVIWEGTPDGDSMQLQLHWAGSGIVEVNSIQVEKTGQAGTSLYTFRKNDKGSYDEYVFKLSEHGDYAAGDPVKVIINMSSPSGFNGTVGTNEKGTWKNKDYTTSGDSYEVEATWEGVPDADSMHIQLYWADAEIAEVNSIQVEKNPDVRLLVLDDIIQSEDYVYMFTGPETIVLELADYDDDYEEGQGVAVEMNFFSDGNFCAMVEDADYVTAKVPDPSAGDESQEEIQGEELPVATASNAMPAIATASNAMPAAPRTKAKAEPKAKRANTLLQEKEQLDEGLAIATASNAEAAEATSSNASPAETGIYVGGTAGKTSEVIVYESEEDGTLRIKWFGNPQSGAIAVTILDMEGTQVNIDTMDVEEKAGAVSVKSSVAATAGDMASPNQKKEDGSVEPDPAKKEDSLEERLSHGNGEAEEPEEEPGEPEGGFLEPKGQPGKPEGEFLEAEERSEEKERGLEEDAVKEDPIEN
ncbi:MAG: hypothetical protein HFG59_01480 [Lachnospiraceae bacterium]|nr:hypothetical protein [Lachnospiraceae bacterium]